jgi:hypothetical protein
MAADQVNLVLKQRLFADAHHGLGYVCQS